MALCVVSKSKERIYFTSTFFIDKYFYVFSNNCRSFEIVQASAFMSRFYSLHGLFYATIFMVVFNICREYADAGLFDFMRLWCSRNRICRLILVWPTYNLSHVLHLELRIPTVIYLFSILFWGLSSLNKVFGDRQQ